jgi:AraC-like DNA-binding protein
MSDVIFSIFPNENFIDLSLYQCGKEKCDPGHSFGPAARNHFLFHYVVSGKGKVMLPNKDGKNEIYTIQAGQGFLLFPGVVSTYWADDKDPWEYLWLEFDGLRVITALSLVNMDAYYPVYRSLNEQLRTKMVEEMNYILQNPKETPFHTIAHLYLFFDYLTRSAKNTQVVATSKMATFYVRECLTYIEQNYQNPITIEEIAAALGINRSYLGKIFHRIVGKSPQQFLIQYRMAKATELLNLTSLKIGEIAKEVGYENQLHFSRIFKNTYEVSPKQWRQQNRLSQHLISSEETERNNG